MRWCHDKILSQPNSPLHKQLHTYGTVIDANNIMERSPKYIPRCPQSNWLSNFYNSRDILKLLKIREWAKKQLERKFWQRQISQSAAAVEKNLRRPRWAVHVLVRITCRPYTLIFVFYSQCIL